MSMQYPKRLGSSLSRVNLHTAEYDTGAPRFLRRYPERLFRV